MIPNQLLNIEVLWLYYEQAKRKSLLSMEMTTKEDRESLKEFTEMLHNKDRSDRLAQLGYVLIKIFIRQSRLPICCSTLFKPVT